MGAETSSKIYKLLQDQNIAGLTGCLVGGFFATTLELDEMLSIRNSWMNQIPHKIGLLGIAGLKKGNSARVNYVFQLSGEQSGILDVEIRFPVDKKAPSLNAIWGYSISSETELAIFEGIAFDLEIKDSGVKWLI